MGKPAAQFPANLPRFGVVVGGDLDGWRYALEDMLIVGGKPVIDARCTPPHWPFPHAHTIRFRPGDFDFMFANADDVPQPLLIDTQQFIKAATAAAKNK
jgi:hypothetical protein